MQHALTDVSLSQHSMPSPEHNVAMPLSAGTSLLSLRNVTRRLLLLLWSPWRWQAAFCNHALNYQPNDSSQHHPCSNHIIVCVAAIVVDNVPKGAFRSDDALIVVTLKIARSGLAQH